MKTLALLQVSVASIALASISVSTTAHAEPPKAPMSAAPVSNGVPASVVRAAPRAGQGEVARTTIAPAKEQPANEKWVSGRVFEVPPEARGGETPNLARRIVSNAGIADAIKNSASHVKFAQGIARDASEELAAAKAQGRDLAEPQARFVSASIGVRAAEELHAAILKLRPRTDNPAPPGQPWE